MFWVTTNHPRKQSQKPITRNEARTEASQPHREASQPHRGASQPHRGASQPHREASQPELRQASHRQRPVYSRQPPRFSVHITGNVFGVQNLFRFSACFLSISAVGMEITSRVWIAHSPRQMSGNCRSLLSFKIFEKCLPGHVTKWCDVLLSCLNIWAIAVEMA